MGGLVYNTTYIILHSPNVNIIIGCSGTAKYVHMYTTHIHTTYTFCDV